MRKKILTDKERIYFRGFLTNADASILRLSLDHGFKIDALSENEYLDFIAVLDNIPRAEVGRFLEIPCLNLNERKVYVINNPFETSLSTRGQGLIGNTARFDNKFVLGYLNSVIRLMRLFKEGDIRMPVKYYYYAKNGKPKGRVQKSTSLRYISREPYHLESSELADLLKFVHSIKLPFKEPFLQLAFENPELSYEILNTGLSFLTLIISSETLLNPAGHELRYRISRNAAVLLGKDKDDSRKIFLEIKELYDKRSEVVHTGKSKIEKRALLKLRYYVRESIKKINRMGRSKNQVLELLNSQGFGEG